MNLLEKYQTEYQDSVRINYHEPTGLYILRYLHNGVDFTDPLLRMARSLVLDPEGHIIMRGFNKFFTHRQYDTREEIPESFKVEYTRLIVPDADHKVTFWEKYDGTCITVGLYNDDYIIATPRALELPPYAPRVRKLLADTPQVKEWLKANPGHALVFEYISPDNLINVRYDYEALAVSAQLAADIEAVNGNPELEHEVRIAFHKRRDIEGIITSTAWLNYRKGIHPLENFAKEDKKYNVTRLIIDRKNKVTKQ